MPGFADITLTGGFMSYLNPLRLHFSGSFEAAVSTVNNDAKHYNNDTFQPSYQKRQEGKIMNGWWNPRGSNVWRLHRCAVKSAFLRDGTRVSRDPVISTATISDSAATAPAKLVDLDTEQQLVSTIYGLEIRLIGLNGATLLSGQFQPAPFMDIWTRCDAAQGDMKASAMYQSVLTDLRWGNIGASKFLSQLKETASAGTLSIKFNVDAYQMNFKDPRFALGRITGTIGPTLPGEPRHFVAGRQFMTVDDPANKSFFKPIRKLNFCAGVLDPVTRRFYLDLGNALPTDKSGEITDLGDLTLWAYSGDKWTPDYQVGTLPAATYTQTHPSWYEETAGVAVFPADRPLTDEEFTLLDTKHLGITGPGPHNQEPAAIRESPDGLFIRADECVFRLSPGDKQDLRLLATRFGHPYPNAGVHINPTPQYLQPDDDPALAVGVPEDAIRYDEVLITDNDGAATLHIEARDPGTPRSYIDGQVYALYPFLDATMRQPFEAPYPYDPANFISLLVFSGFQPDEPPTWHGSIHKILQQYANLYPIMADFLDLGDYDSVCKHAKTLAYAFGLDISDPNSMPVTRDLSPAKRAAIIRWLTTPGKDNLPLLGTAPVQRATPDPPGGRPSPTGGDLAGLATGGGKLAAVYRRPASGAEPADVILGKLRALQAPGEATS
jgi:hypothetical protein